MEFDGMPDVGDILEENGVVGVRWMPVACLFEGVSWLVIVTSSACSYEDTVCTNNHKFIYSPKRCYCYKISSAQLRVRASLNAW